MFYQCLSCDEKHFPNKNEAHRVFVPKFGGHSRACRSLKKVYLYIKFYFLRRSKEFSSLVVFLVDNFRKIFQKIEKT